MALRLRHYYLTATLTPLLYAAGVLIAGFTIPRLASNALPGLGSTVSVNAAIGIYSAVASGMIALTGIVFSLTFVMVSWDDGESSQCNRPNARTEEITGVSE